jgi:hypothetical protein
VKNTLIALHGGPSVGKTTTIKIVSELFADKVIGAVVESQNERLRCEVFVIITINGKRIGITSKGDRFEHLKNPLNIFAKNKCNVILCATRTDRSDSWKGVNKFSIKNKYYLHDIKKVGMQTQSQYDKSNKIYAEEIFQFIKRLLNLK